MNLIGHKIQWEFLKKSAERGRIPHALLFSGPSQIGKKRVAVEFIKLLNCEEREEEKRPCGICPNCSRIEKGIFPDLKIIQSKGKEIQISQIREARNYLSLKPFQGKIKALIIDEAERMNEEAQSAFLKILEEPRGETLLILVTENSERLFPTIISRCELIRFSLISQKEIISYLLKEGVSFAQAREICYFSGGRPGLAIEFLRNPEKLKFWKRSIEKIITLINSPLQIRFEYAKVLSGESQNLREVLENWLRFFREVLIKKITQKKIEEKVLRDYPVERLIKNIKLLEEIYLLVSKTNVNPRLALEVLLMEM